MMVSFNFTIAATLFGLPPIPSFVVGSISVLIGEGAIKYALGIVPDDKDIAISVFGSGAGAILAALVAGAFLIKVA